MSSSLYEILEGVNPKVVYIVGDKNDNNLSNNIIWNFAITGNFLLI